MVRCFTHGCPHARPGEREGCHQRGARVRGSGARGVRALQKDQGTARKRVRTPRPRLPRSALTPSPRDSTMWSARELSQRVATCHRFSKGAGVAKIDLNAQVNTKPSPRSSGRSERAPPVSDTTTARACACCVYIGRTLATGRRVAPRAARNRRRLPRALASSTAAANRPPRPCETKSYMCCHLSLLAYH